MNSEEDKDNKNEAAEKSSKKKDYRPHQRNLISVNSILHSVIKDKKLVQENKTSMVGANGSTR